MVGIHHLFVHSSTVVTRVGVLALVIFSTKFYFVYLVRTVSLLFQRSG